jgi:hypothetical protein
MASISMIFKVPANARTDTAMAQNDSNAAVSTGMARATLGRGAPLVTGQRLVR